MLLLAAAVLLAALHSPPAAAQRAGLSAVLGVEPDGTASGAWLAMLGQRLGVSEAADLASSVKRLTDAERRWEELIRSRLTIWEGRRDALAEPFAPIPPPPHATIVMGNRGGDDAFTHDAVTMGFDLSVLQSAYGDATLSENRQRIDRFFDHEYTHLLQKGWLVARPYPADSPLRAALLDIWLEGLGQLRSLSDRWRSTAGRPSETARQRLAVLEPRFAARVSALACASTERARPLLADLSRGRFEDKWGALTAALWLENEAAREPDALSRFVREGPDGVWSLASRHLPDPLNTVLAEARHAESVCAGP